MLAYAAKTRPGPVRAGSPRALVLILAGHAVADRRGDDGQDGDGDQPAFHSDQDHRHPDQAAAPPEPQPPQPKPAPQPSFIERPVTVIDVPSIAPTPLDKGPPIVPWNPPVIGDGPPLPIVNPPKEQPVRVAAVFRTPDSALRPPYPVSKLRLEEEATLKLRLSIDARGRVTAVEPVGAADPQFLEAARRHIIRAWRYKPATEGGVAVSSSTVITLSFRLEDA